MLKKKNLPKLFKSLKTISLFPSLVKRLNFAIEKRICITEDKSKSYIYILDRFFVNDKTNEYYYLQEDCFVRTGLYRGSGLNKEIVLNWKKENIKE